MTVYSLFAFDLFASYIEICTFNVNLVFVLLSNNVHLAGSGKYVVVTTVYHSMHW